MRLALLQAAILAAIPMARATAMPDVAPGAGTSLDGAVFAQPKYYPTAEPAKLTSRSVLDVLLGRRQTCAAGYGYCSGEA